MTEPRVQVVDRDDDAVEIALRGRDARPGFAELCRHLAGHVAAGDRSLTVDLPDCAHLSSAPAS